MNEVYLRIQPITLFNIYMPRPGSDTLGEIK